MILRKFRRDSLPYQGHFRFYGKSSNMVFLQTVLDIRDNYTGIERPKSAEPALPRSNLTARAPPANMDVSTP